MIEHGDTIVTDARPSLAGFDILTSSIVTLTNHVIALRIERNGVKSKLKTLPGPLFPIEVAQERVRHRATQKRDSAIDRAMDHYRSKHGASKAPKPTRRPKKTPSTIPPMPPAKWDKVKSDA